MVIIAQKNIYVLQRFFPSNPKWGTSCLHDTCSDDIKNMSIFGKGLHDGGTEFPYLFYLIKKNVVIFLSKLRKT